MGVAQKACYPSRITKQTFSAYLGHQWSTMQLQNQRKRFYLIYLITFLLKYDPKILLYENLLHTPSHGETLSEYPGLHCKLKEKKI